MVESAQAEAAIIAALGSIVVLLLGWVSGLFRWLFGWPIRRATAEQRLLTFRGQTIDDLVIDLGTANAEITRLRDRVGALERGQLEDAARLEKAHAEVLKQVEARCETQIRALQTAHDLDRQRWQSRLTADIEDATADLAAEIARLRGENAELLGRLNPSVRPTPEQHP